MERHFSALYPKNTRFDEVKKVLGYVLSGNVAEIIGIPGVGRTVFMGLLAFNKAVKTYHLGQKAKKYHFVLIDFSPFKGESLEGIVRSIFFTIIESLEERQLHEEAQVVKQTAHEYGSHADALSLFQGLRRAVDYLTHERGLSVVFLCDSFEVYAPYIDPRFFTQITALRDHMRYNVSFIFSSNRPLATLVDKEYTAVITQLISGHTVWLSLADTVSNEFVKTFIEKQFSREIAPTLFQTILVATAGHAKLVKVALEESLQEGIAADDFDTYAAENKALKSVCEEIWDSLHADEQRILIGRSSGGDTVDTGQLNYLHAVHVINNGTVRIPLFSTFIQALKLQDRGSRFAYNEQTNDILKNDAVITENFTATEFRLLHYLLTHRDQIIDRDTLIQVAWAEAKSTAGVSEQALDQLLYRLRQKIEESPTNPMHLQTIKGRGVKFVP